MQPLSLSFAKIFKLKCVCVHQTLNGWYLLRCVVLVYFFTLHTSIFENFLLDDKLLTLLTKHHMIKAERAQTKSGKGAIGYCLIIVPQVEITLLFCGICSISFDKACMWQAHMYYYSLHRRKLVAPGYDYFWEYCISVRWPLCTLNFLILIEFHDSELQIKDNETSIQKVNKAVYLVCSYTTSVKALNNVVINLCQVSFN